MSVCFIPPYTPLLYSKTGVYRGLHYFRIFALKHIRVPTIFVLGGCIIDGRIRITCLYVLYPLTPHFYIVKLGFTGVYIIFVFLL